MCFSTEEPFTLFAALLKQLHYIVINLKLERRNSERLSCIFCWIFCNFCTKDQPLYHIPDTYSGSLGKGDCLGGHGLFRMSDSIAHETWKWKLHLTWRLNFTWVWFHQAYTVIPKLTARREWPRSQGPAEWDIGRLFLKEDLLFWGGLHMKVNR